MLQCATVIYETFTLERTTGSGSPLADEVYLAGDDFLPIFIFVVVQSNVRELPMLLKFMQCLCDPDLLAGKGGYYLTVLESVIQCIRIYDLAQQSIFGA